MRSTATLSFARLFIAVRGVAWHALDVEVFCNAVGRQVPQAV